jgi:ATP-binding cassette subfamily B protein
MKQKKEKSKEKKPGVFSLLKPYTWFVILLIVVTIVGNALTLVIPKFIAAGIDAYTKSHVLPSDVLPGFLAASLGIFIFTYIQSIVQTYIAELAGRDLREKLANKISRQSYLYIERVTPSRLLTNLTSDIDAIKQFISLAIPTIVSSLFLIIGSVVLLLTTNLILGLAVLTIIPLIGGTFFFILRKIRVLFIKTQGVIDALNKVINESILGSALIRVLQAQQTETEKFTAANAEARDIGLKILGYFSAMIPMISFFASLGTLLVLVLGGHFVIQGAMTLGDFAAFNSYIAIFVFPIIMIGFMTGIIARANASYTRIVDILDAKEEKSPGTLTDKINGNIMVKDVTVRFGEKNALQSVSFVMKQGTRNAIIGPTAAGKTQILYLLSGLTRPDTGTILYDKHSIDEYDLQAFHNRIGFVFQDSVLFNMTLRENIAFSESTSEIELEKAIATAELHEFIKSQPKGLETIVSERGTSLSGGQKQRIMLARALALNPSVLLLDDFTARVDANTEQKILANMRKNYPDMTLLSVTQKIASVVDYDQIIMLMEGEVIAKGTHKELMKTAPDYVQLYKSQQSTNTYELSTE